MRVVDITKYTECECVASTTEMHFSKGQRLSQVAGLLILVLSCECPLFATSSRGWGCYDLAREITNSVVFLIRI